MVLGDHVAWKTAPKTINRIKIESLIYIKHRPACPQGKRLPGVELGEDILLTFPVNVNCQRARIHNTADAS
jgi:hypothetical protein